MRWIAWPKKDHTTKIQTPPTSLSQKWPSTLTSSPKPNTIVRNQRITVLMKGRPSKTELALPRKARTGSGPVKIWSRRSPPAQ